MLTDFLNHTCDITETTVNIVGGEEIKTITTIYSGISCHLYNQSGKINETGLAENTNLTNAKLFIEPNKVLVRKAMKVIVTDPSLGELGTYELDTIQMNRLINGGNDSIQITLKSI